MAFRVFISHDVDSDGHIAGLLQRELKTLSNGEVECQICSQQPGGIEWRRWIEDEVSKCDLFLYLYTTDRRRQDWLLFEAGVFLGARRIINDGRDFPADPDPNGNTHSSPSGPDDTELLLTRTIKTDLVCIKSHGIPTPPAPIGYLQAYEATRDDLLRFIEDLIVIGEFSSGKPLNKRLHVDFDKPPNPETPSQLATAVRAIEDAFACSSIKSRFYSRRMVIGPFDPGAFDDLSPGAVPLFPPDTQVDVSDRAQGLIELPQLESGVRHRWAHIEVLERSENGAWVEDLRKVAANVTDGLAFEPILTPFSSKNGRRCYPIVSRVDTIQSKVHRFSVIFVEHEPDEKPNELATSIKRAPANFQTVVAMANLARRTRWNVIEVFDDAMRTPRAERQSASELAVELESNLSRLIAEAHEQGWMNPEVVASVFPELMHGEIGAMFQRYEAWFDNLQAITEAPEVAALETAVEELKRINKRFWLMTLDRYDELVDSLTPKDLNSMWAVAREASSAQAWEYVLDAWRGVARDIEIPGLLEFEPCRAFELSLTISRRGRDVSGALHIDATPGVGSGEHQIADAAVRGLFAVDRYFAFDYRVKYDDGEPRFGIMLMKIADEDSRMARGLFLSKRAFEHDKMGFGQVIMVRENTDLVPEFDKGPKWTPAKGKARAKKTAAPGRAKPKAGTATTAPGKTSADSKIATKEKPPSPRSPRKR